MGANPHQEGKCVLNISVIDKQKFDLAEMKLYMYYEY
jgi:hypothetical protein